MTRLVSTALLLAALVGCATTNLPPVGTPGYTTLEDEKRLWSRSEGEQQTIDRSGMLFEDKALEKYVNDVARKLPPAEVAREIPYRIQVLDNPYSNAFAFANGAIYVHTGILARMDNEAQLASLLAHEMAHASHRHQLREFRGVRNKSAVFASMRATLGGLPAIGGLATALGELGTVAAVTGYSRDLEREADQVGIEWMVAAGYDPKEAPKLFLHLKAEAEEEEIKEPFFFGSHPKLKERIRNYEEFLEAYPGQGGKVNRETFEKKVAGAVYATALLDLRAGRFAKAERGAKRYAAIHPKDGKGHYLLGEIHRQQGALEDAKTHFGKAISLDPSCPDPYRAMGMLHLKEGEKSQAKKSFKAYLAKSPKAEDRSYIEEYIRQCQ